MQFFLLFFQLLAPYLLRRLSPCGSPRLRVADVASVATMGVEPAPHRPLAASMCVHSILPRRRAGKMVSKMLSSLLGNKEYRVLILGLDNAGAHPDRPVLRRRACAAPPRAVSRPSRLASPVLSTPQRAAGGVCSPRPRELAQRAAAHDAHARTSAHAQPARIAHHTRGVAKW